MPTKDQTPDQVGTLGAGSEAAPSKEAQPKEGNAPARDREHKGSYGGEGGAPRESSDNREPLKPD